jgi:type 1 glutamine amidotransferase
MTKIPLAFFLLAATLSLGCANSENREKRILIYTKNGEGPGKYIHDNIAASVEALQKICTENGIASDVSEDPTVFTDDNLDRYGAIVFSNTNNEAFDTEEQKSAFVRYIQDGGGFVGIHSACGSERKWPWFWAMIGGSFVRHPALQPFDIKVIDRSHPTTDFLGETWKWEDECYFIDHLNPDIHILLAVDLETIDDPEKGKYPGEVFGRYFPLAWVHEFDGGREFYCALGHKIEHYSDPLFMKHLLRGIMWAMDVPPEDL